MIKVKHFMDAVEEDDGQRLWIEPIGCAKDLCQMCRVDHVLTHLGPPKKLWDWFNKHPEEYDQFRGQYHDCLRDGPYNEALKDLAQIAQHETFTLLHQSEDANHNSAAALYEYLIELQAWCPPE